MRYQPWPTNSHQMSQQRLLAGPARRFVFTG
ncbi:hypothetical protein SAJA_10640 [Salinisphaera japonica YTM-1]|uniref:Uncharacterized protein n=1 Tax=Salinisphaera japonica YTM-1 TaxID=1209778 RepID=A0A423PLY3_9GAMM|nr:hypothetical protein SAJA_10640 [Salinisphaera japonica YTM-1]